MRLQPLLLGLLLGMAAVPGNATAAGIDPALGAEWVALPASRLAALRGGFVLPSGMQVSFGIERLVYVNGNLVASARVTIPDLGRITAQQARELSDASDGLVVQVGEGNTFAPAGMAANALVIQNTVNGQDISALTTIDVGVGSLGMFQSINANDALQTALQRAPGLP
ncbi:MAG: hypothetical protein ABIO84_05170 [Lysobacter sp.]